MLPVKIHRLVISKPGNLILIFILISLFASSTKVLGIEDEVSHDYPLLFRFGVLNVLPSVNLKDAQVAIEMNFARQKKEAFPGSRVEMEILEDVSGAIAMFERKQLHSILLTSLDYLALREKVDIEPLFISSRTDEPLEAYVILTSKEIASIDQLARQPNRRIIVEDFGANSIGRAWLDTVLWEHDGRGSDSFFTSIRKADKPTQLLLPVFFGQAEACLVPESIFQTMRELNPQIGKRLKILMRSPGFVRTILCTSAGLNSELVEAIRSNAMNMADSTDGQQLMMIFQVQHQFPFKPDYLKASRRIYEQSREHRKVF